jgi:hypothetical protein
MEMQKAGMTKSRASKYDAYSSDDSESQANSINHSEHESDEADSRVHAISAPAPVHLGPLPVGPTASTTASTKAMKPVRVCTQYLRLRLFV